MRERIDGVAYMDEGPRGPPEGALEHPVSKSSNLVVPKRCLVANRRTVPGHQNPAAPPAGSANEYVRPKCGGVRAGVA